MKDEMDESYDAWLARMRAQEAQEEEKAFLRNLNKQRVAMWQSIDEMFQRGRCPAALDNPPDVEARLVSDAAFLHSCGIDPEAA